MYQNTKFFANSPPKFDLFGSAPASTTTSGSVFGSAPASTGAGGSVFGSTQASKASGGSVFGSATATTTSAAGFGSSGSVFGSAPAAASGASVFGSTPASTGGAAFGGGAAPAQEAAQGLPGHPHHHRPPEAGSRPLRVCGECSVMMSHSSADIGLTCTEEMHKMMKGLGFL